jgi:hypothetical protein
MFVFFWLLMSMGVAYWAKLDGRNPAFWFFTAVILSPLMGSILLWAVAKYGPQI